MASKSRVSTVADAVPAGPLSGAPCQCLADFFREEFQKHHRCLEQHREYYSEIAIEQAEAALGRILQQMEALCRRDDACEVVGSSSASLNPSPSSPPSLNPKPFIKHARRDDPRIW